MNIVILYTVVAATDIVRMPKEVVSSFLLVSRDFPSSLSLLEYISVLASIMIAELMTLMNCKGDTPKTKPKQHRIISETLCNR